MALKDLPSRAGAFTERGLNTIISELDSKRQLAADELEGNPRAVIERTVLLTSEQRSQLAELDDEELAELVQPVIEALRNRRPFRLRIVSLDDGAAEKAARPQQPGGQPQQPPAPKKKCRVKIEVEVEL